MDEKRTSDLITDMFSYRVSIAKILNKVLQGKNLNVGSREFNRIMESRFKNFVGTDYKIFDSSRRGFLQVLLNQRMRLKKKLLIY